MAWREWAVPVALGVVVAGGTWAWFQFGPGTGEVDDGTGPQPPHESELLYVFEDSPWVAAPWPGEPADVLVIAPDANDAYAGRGIDPGDGGPVWWSPNVAIQQTTNGDIQCIKAPCEPLQGPAIHHVAPESAAVFGAGYEAVNATLYVFDPLGHVVASNIAEGNITRFEVADDFFDLPTGTWYLGEGPAPPGTEELPPWIKEIARPLLEGLPVGGVATLRADQHRYSWLTGELFLTARVEGLVRTD